MRILLVEDDRDFVDGLKPRLEGMGNVVVTVAESRDAAFRIFDELPTVFIDIVVLDLKLPTSNSSFDAYFLTTDKPSSHARFKLRLAFPSFF